MNKKTKAILSGIGAAILSGAVAATPEVATRMVYEAIFNKRVTSYEPLAFQVSDFANLQREKHVFTSNNGQKLVGYMYFNTTVEQKGVVVMSHGFGGGGQRTYMDCANYFAEKGFYVFAYDATANDESEGEGISGFPQGTIDLSYAINYVKSNINFNKYPMFLFGHSWGGYNVCNVLNFQTDIKAVCAISGFNKSSGVIEANAHNYAVRSEDVVLPYMEHYEEKIFGQYSTTSSMSGFQKSNAGVYIVHSGDDKVVPYTAGYKIYWEEYKNNPRFKFTLYEDRGHGTAYYNLAGVQYTNTWKTKWDEFLKGQPSEEEKLAYISNNLDRSIWTNRLDKQLFNNIVEFYNQYI